MTPERLAELRSRASRPRRTVPIVCNGDLAERIDNAQDELLSLDRAATGGRLASKSNSATAAALEKQLDDLYVQAEADTLLLVVEGLEGTVWRALIAQYPPTPGEDGKPRGGYDAFCDREAFEEPLIRAATIGMRATVDAENVAPLPDGTLDWFFGFATALQRETLFIAAWVCSRGDDAVPLRRRRSTTRSSVAE